MAIQACTCSSHLGNTGTPRCEVLFKAPAGMLLTSVYADDGTRNFIDLTTTLNQVYFDGLTQNSDPSKRVYPLHNIKNVETERAESIKFEYADGSSFEVQDGVRPFSLILPKSGTTFLSKLKQNSCKDQAFWDYDIEGNLRGEISADRTKLYPIRMSSGTWSAIAAFATDTTITENRVNFQFDKNVKDSLLRLIQPSEMDSVQMSGLLGLFDINAVYSAATAAGFTMALTDDYGTAITQTPIKDLLLADFTFTEISPTPGDITGNVASVTETPASSGIYAVVFTIPEVAGDEIHVDIDITKNYDTQLTGNVTLL